MTSAELVTALAAKVSDDYSFKAEGGSLVVTAKIGGSAGSFTVTAKDDVLTAGALVAGGGIEIESKELTAAKDGVTAASSNTISTLSVLDGTKAAAAILTIDNALTSVGQERSKLGAFQNRLTHAVNNMTNMSANTAAAKSVVADADYAAESSSLAKSQILQQAGTAMLAQANAQAQSVLSLLK
jgi:flagellin